jgi:hypothetical protein
MMGVCVCVKGVLCDLNQALQYNTFFSAGAFPPSFGGMLSRFWLGLGWVCVSVEL